MTPTRVRLVADEEIARGTVVIGGPRLLREDQLTFQEVFTRVVRVHPAEVEGYRAQLADEEAIEVVE